MDRERFNALALLLATTGSRRRAMSALLGVALLGQSPEALANRQHGQSKGKSKSRDRGHGSRQQRRRAGDEDDTPDDSSVGDGGPGEDGEGEQADGAEDGGEIGRQRGRASADSRDTGSRHNGKGTGKRRRRDKGKGNDRRRKADVQAAAARCFNGRPCRPGSGANLQNCDFTGSSALKNVNCTGCNAGGISLIGGDASGANFRGANLGNACLIDADLTNAKFNGGTNLSGTLFCRTTMPDGSVNNSGCDRDTRCCGTCIAIGGVCGAGIGGSCYGGATCQSGICACPANEPHNCNGVCQQCCNDGNCSGSTPKCCGGVCRKCCAAGNCPAQECRTANCTVQGTCTYTVVADNRSGPLCPSPLVCCNGGCCDSGQVCDTRGSGAVCCTKESPTATCDPPSGEPRCGMTRNNCGVLVDCGPCAEVVCNTGECNDGSHTCDYTPAQDLTRCDTESDASGICCDGDCVDGNCCVNANCTRNANACANNTCRCGSGPACTFENPTCCGASPAGTCVDTSRDRNNCGGCGQRCTSSNQVCTGNPPRCCQPRGIFCSLWFGLNRRCCTGVCQPAFGLPLGFGYCT